jgi:hypothetical protein
MESLFSFPVGLLHPLQHAGLARRSPNCRPVRASDKALAFIRPEREGSEQVNGCLPTAQACHIGLPTCCKGTG